VLYATLTRYNAIANEDEPGSVVLLTHTRDAQARKILNQEEVLDYLRETYHVIGEDVVDALRERGHALPNHLVLRVVDASKLDPCQQIAVFKSAVLVIGVHGAHLTNVIFMRPSIPFAHSKPGGLLVEIDLKRRCQYSSKTWYQESNIGTIRIPGSPGGPNDYAIHTELMLGGPVWDHVANATVAQGGALGRCEEKEGPADLQDARFRTQTTRIANGNRTHTLARGETRGESRDKTRDISASNFNSLSSVKTLPSLRPTSPGYYSTFARNAGVVYDLLEIDIPEYDARDDPLQQKWRDHSFTIPIDVLEEKIRGTMLPWRRGAGYHRREEDPGSDVGDAGGNAGDIDHVGDAGGKEEL
jgi:hypothetical protein